MLSTFPISPALAISDIKRARDFYGNTLGFTPIWESDGGYSVFYKSGGVDFEVHQTPSASTNEATAAQRHIDDLRAMVTDLKSKGVTFEDLDFGDDMETATVFSPFLTVR